MKKINRSSAEKKPNREVVSIYNNKNSIGDVQHLNYFNKGKAQLPETIKININRVADNLTTQVNSQNYSLDQVNATPIKEATT